MTEGAPPDKSDTFRRYARSLRLPGRSGRSTHRLFMKSRVPFALLAVLALAGCSHLPPPAEAVRTVEASLPAVWYAPPLPHGGKSEALADWWGRLGDPLLPQLILEAQNGSASVAAARAQVYGARAALAGVDSGAGPQLALTAGAYRGVNAQAPLGTGMNVGLQASWVLDVWGQNAASVRQAGARQQAAEAGWHEARVLMAAETARLYLGWQACMAQRAVWEADARSRAVTARNATHTERAGLLAPATAALAHAGLADAENRLVQQTRQCEQSVKAITALTGAEEARMRQRLGPGGSVPAAAAVAAALPPVSAVPLEVVRQRPDVARSQQELVAAAEGAGVAVAALMPSLSLSGSMLRNRFAGADSTTLFNTWSVGPLTLNLPLLGRAGLSASAEAAQAQYEAAGLAYANTLRRAIAEVEQALVALDALERQQVANDQAVAGYQRSLQATEARHRVGLAALNELEEARRLKLAADSGAVALNLDRINTWIALYVALGGGFDPSKTPEPLRKPS
jgi:outer membrane protein, multidrug efflux system